MPCFGGACNGRGCIPPTRGNRLPCARHRAETALSAAARGPLYADGCARRAACRHAQAAQARPGGDRAAELLRHRQHLHARRHGRARQRARRGGAAGDGERRTSSTRSTPKACAACASISPPTARRRSRPCNAASKRPRACARELGWHVQIFVPADALEPLAPVLRALPVDTVIDHFGLIDPDAPDERPRDAAAAHRHRQGVGEDFRRLPHRQRPATIRASIRWRARSPPPTRSASSGARTGRTRRPTTSITPTAARNCRSRTSTPPDCWRWCRAGLTDDALVHRVLVDNPARLYGFSA